MEQLSAIFINVTPAQEAVAKGRSGFTADPETVILGLGGPLGGDPSHRCS